MRKGEKMKAYRSEKQLGLKSGVSPNTNIHEYLLLNGCIENTNTHTYTLKLLCSELDHHNRD